jgi:hypothetical protein
LFHTDGSSTVIVPANGKHYTLDELQGFVGGLIELVPGPRTGQLGIANEEGLCLGLDHNFEASKIFGTTLVGPVAVIRSNRMR